MSGDYWRSRLHLPLFIAVSLAAFFHCLFLGQAYFSVDLLHQYSHFRALLKNQLLLGHFPLWNPYFFGGQPFFADPNVMMAYPLNYLTLLFPIPYGFGIFYFLHMVLAACGTRYWLKALRLSETASRVGSLLFVLSGFFWWELIHPPILAAFCWFPAWMGSLEKLSRDLSPRRAFLSGLLFALLFTCGNFQMTSYFLYAGLFYFFGRLLLPAEGAEPPAPKPAWKKAARVLLFGAWGSLPLLVHLIPAYEFSKYTNRRSPDQTYESFNAEFSMTPSSLYQVLFPSLGVPKGQTLENSLMTFEKTSDIPPVTYDDYDGAYAFLGIWAPFLVLLAFRRREKRLLYLLWGLALLSVLAAWGGFFPLHKILCAVLPGVNLSRAPFRFVGVYAAFACVLAAYGYQALERALEEKTGASGLVWGALAYSAALFLVGFLNPGEAWREMLALGLGALGIFLWGRVPAWGRMGRLFFISALLFPMLLSAWSGYTWGPVSNYDYERNFPFFAELKARSKEGRFYFHQSLGYPVEAKGKRFYTAFPEDTVVEMSVRTAMGYNPIFLVKPAELRSLPSYLQLLSIRGLLFGQDAREIKGFTHKTVGGLHYYESQNPPSFVAAPFQWRVIPEDRERLMAMKNPSFNPAEAVYLSESLPPAVASQLPGQTARLSYEWVKDDPNEEAFKVRLGKNSLAVFSEVMFPGWKARVDGSPAEIFTGNHAFRTLFLTAGEHLVEFRYEPAWAKPLLAGSILWLVSALGYVLFLVLPRRNIDGTGSGLSASKNV